MQRRVNDAVIPSRLRPRPLQRPSSRAPNAEAQPVSQQRTRMGAQRRVNDPVIPSRRRAASAAAAHPIAAIPTEKEKLPARGTEASPLVVLPRTGPLSFDVTAHHPELGDTERPCQGFFGLTPSEVAPAVAAQATWPVGYRASRNA